MMPRGLLRLGIMVGVTALGWAQDCTEVAALEPLVSHARLGQSVRVLFVVPACEGGGRWALHYDGRLAVETGTVYETPQTLIRELKLEELGENRILLVVQRRDGAARLVKGSVMVSSAVRSWLGHPWFGPVVGGVFTLVVFGLHGYRDRLRELRRFELGLSAFLSEVEGKGQVLGDSIPDWIKDPGNSRWAVVLSSWKHRRVFVDCRRALLAWQRDPNAKEQAMERIRKLTEVIGL